LKNITRTFNNSGFEIKNIAVKGDKVSLYAEHDFSEREFKIFLNNSSFSFSFNGITKIEFKEVNITNQMNVKLVKALRVLMKVENLGERDWEVIIYATPEEVTELDRFAQVLKTACPQAVK